MGLLDEWGGLLDAPIKRMPWQRPAPLLMPLTEAAYGEPSSGNIWNANPPSLGKATGGVTYQPAAIAPAPQASALAMMAGAGGGQPVGSTAYAQQPKLPPQNLTTQALRTRGVPEAHIAAAIGNPELMKQLIYRNFSPGSAGTAALKGYATDGSGVLSAPYGDSSQHVADPEARSTTGSLQEPTPAAARPMSCIDAYEACRRAGFPYNTCRNAFTVCGKGSSTIFPPGVWGDPGL
jgi:hypothetical protein